MALLEMDLRSGELDEATELMRTLLARGAEQRDRVRELAWATAPSNPDAAFVVIDALVDAAGAAGNFADAAALLHELASRVPNQIPALLKLVEVCVDGGLEATMYEAQAHLADAYLGVGLAAYIAIIVAVLGIHALHSGTPRYGRLGATGTVLTIAGYAFIAVMTVISMVQGYASFLTVRLAGAGVLLVAPCFSA